jgi:hypothetical protein
MNEGIYHLNPANPCHPMKWNKCFLPRQIGVLQSFQSSDPFCSRSPSLQILKKEKEERDRE